MSLRAYLALLRPHLASLAGAALLLAATASVPALAVWLLRSALDRFAAGDLVALAPACAAFVGLYAAHGAGVVARTAMSKRVAWRLASDLRRQLHRQWLDAAPAGAVGDRLAALTDEVDQVQYGVSAGVTALRNPLALAGLTITAAVMAPSLAPLALLLLLPTGLVAWLGGRRVRVVAAAARRARASLLALLHAQLTGLETVQAFGAQAAERIHLATADDLDRSARLRLEVERTIPTLAMQVLVAAALAVLMLIGAQQVTDGVLTASSLVAFVVALGLAARPLSGLVEVWSLLQRSLAALERVQIALQTPPAVPLADQPVAIADGPVDLAWTDAGFDVADRSILAGITLTARPGELLAIVGSTGAGKTTLLRLAWRAMDPTGGTVSLGGVRLADLHPTALREAVAVVPQDLFLFGRTILDNVALADPAPDEARAAEALHQAGASFALDLGLHAVLEEGGRGLSGGERQRLCLARALYRRARVLLLDEPTSQVDPQMSASLGDTLRDLRPGRTIVVVAHDPALAMRADRVARIEEGRLQGVGDPDVMLGGGRWIASSAR